MAAGVGVLRKNVGDRAQWNTIIYSAVITVCEKGCGAQYAVRWNSYKDELLIFSARDAVGAAGEARAQKSLEEQSLPPTMPEKPERQHMQQKRQQCP